MKSELKSVIENLNPKVLGLNKIKIDSFKKLGVGEGNLNYFFKIKGKKFICRLNIDKKMPNKSKNEYVALKIVEKLNIAPKTYYMHKKDKKFPYGFIILDFIEGKPFRMKKRNYTKLQIKELANNLANLHSKKCSVLKKINYSYSPYLDDGKYYIKELNKYTKSRFDREIRQLYYEIKNFLPKKEYHTFALVHNDICPQNIVETNNKLKLIDWESLECSDPGKDIAHILVDLELKGVNLNLFMREYQKRGTDKNILERAKIYAVLLRYANFMWELVRSFEILNKELPKDYLRKTSAKEHINEAKFQFKRLRKLLNVRCIDIDEIFKKYWR